MFKTPGTFVWRFWETALKRETLESFSLQLISHLCTQTAAIFKEKVEKDEPGVTNKDSVGWGAR